VRRRLARMSAERPSSPSAPNVWTCDSARIPFVVLKSPVRPPVLLRDSRLKPVHGDADKTTMQRRQENAPSNASIAVGLAVSLSLLAWALGQFVRLI
jgi:hypothetical protein